jgi:hypothetical protein
MHRTNGILGAMVLKERADNIGCDNRPVVSIIFRIIFSTRQRAGFQEERNRDKHGFLPLPLTSTPDPKF